MLQEEEVIDKPTETPESLQERYSILSSYVVKVCPDTVQNQLTDSYNSYCQKRHPISLGSHLKAKLNYACDIGCAVLQQLWKQIVPSIVRGKFSQSGTSSEIQDKDSIFFAEEKQKKSRFFLVVFHPRVSQEDMQEAFQKSSFIMMQGRGIRICQLSKETNCKLWKVEDWGKLKTYSILFFKFDMFGQLRNFGHLSKQLIDAYKDDSDFLPTFKSQLQNTFDRYEQAEKQFMNSYMEKEHRQQFE